MVTTQLRAAAVVAGECIVASVRAAAAAELVTRERGAGGTVAGEAGDATPPTTPSAAAATLSDAALRVMSTLTEADLDEHLWLLGKAPAYRGLERHATRDTYFY